MILIQSRVTFLIIISQRTRSILDVYLVKRTTGYEILHLRTTRKILNLGMQSKNILLIGVLRMKWLNTAATAADSAKSNGHRKKHGRGRSSQSRQRTAPPSKIKNVASAATPRSKARGNTSKKPWGEQQQQRDARKQHNGRPSRRQRQAGATAATSATRSTSGIPPATADMKPRQSAHNKKDQERIRERKIPQSGNIRSAPRARSKSARSLA